MRFDRIIVADWSASSAPSPARPSADAIWIGTAEAGGGAVSTSYHRTRAEAEAALHAAVEQALAEGTRLLMGFDFPFGYPAGFAAAVTGRPETPALWDWLAERIRDGPRNANNRFDLAARINAALPGVGPFWGRPVGLDLPDLPDRGSLRRDHGFAERRAVETAVPSAQPVWKLYTTGSVGSQALMGQPALSRLRRTFAGRVAAWPFEPAETAPVVLAEVYPSLLAERVARHLRQDPAAIKDEVQVRLLSLALARLARDGGLASLLRPDVPPAVLREEGWILGAGHSATLGAALP